MKNNSHIVMAIALCLTGGTISGQQTIAPQATVQPLVDEATTIMVDALYDLMSQEERIAQLYGMNMNELFTDGHLDTAKCQRLIPYGVGHFCQYASQEKKTPTEVRDMLAQAQQWLVTHTPHAIPALCHEEVLTGIATMGATIYPQQIGIACSFNTELAELKARQTAADLRKIGGQLALSPMVDVCRNPHFNRLEESYGEDSYLSAALGVSFVRGLQGSTLRQGVAACSKHFLGYGGGSETPEKELMSEILLPHEAMIRIAGSKVVMTGYHDFHGVKAVANSELQQQILRRHVGFDGLTVSDYGSISHLQLANQMEKAIAAFNAGNDVEFQSGVNYPYLKEAVAQGCVRQERLEEAVKRVLALKARLGLLEQNPELYAEGHIEFDRPEERLTAYKLATQSVVLLQNKGILPLNTPKRIFLTGPNAHSMYAMLGDYTYQTMAYFWRHQKMDDLHPRIVNLFDGLQKRLPNGYSLEYARGCDWTETIELQIEEGGDERTLQYQQWQYGRMIDGGEEIDRAKAVQMAAKSDVVIAAMGENTMLCGENRDRSHLRLPGSQEAFVEELIGTGKPVVLVIFGGRAQIVSKIADRCAAIIQAWYPGEEGGNAVADILLGNVSPSGKLSVSYPAVEMDENICYNYSEKQDSRIVWPFGYGLSYTTFVYSDLHVSETAPTKDGVIEVSFTVKNTGSCIADEVAQLYLSPTDPRVQSIRPIQLQGFTRITLQPGESRRVTLLMSSQQFGYYGDGHWNISTGKYIVKIGSSSQDIRLYGEVKLIGEKHEMPLRTIYFSEQR